MKSEETIEDFKKWAYKKVLIASGAMTLLLVSTIIAMIFSSNMRKEAVTKKISQLKDPKTKEILMKMQTIRDDKTLSKEYFAGIYTFANMMKEEVLIAQEIMLKKDYVPKTDRIKALQHIINAKGYMEKLKEVKLPVDTVLIQIKQLEKDLYQTTTN